MGDGKTVLKGNWGRFCFNPGVNLADAVNPNTSTQYAECGRGTTSTATASSRTTSDVGSQPTQKFGGTAEHRPSMPTSRTPTPTRPSFFVERAVMNDLGVRVGYVWKKDNNGWQQMNDDRPFSAYNVPVSIVDPGPDGNIATTGDNGTLNLLQPRQHGARHAQRRPQRRGLRGHLQDVRDLGQQALQQALVDERVVLVHLDRRSSATPTSATGSPRSSSSVSLLRAASPSNPERADAATSSPTGTRSSAAPSTPAGACA